MYCNGTFLLECLIYINNNIEHDKKWLIHKAKALPATDTQKRTKKNLTKEKKFAFCIFDLSNDYCSNAGTNVAPLSFLPCFLCHSSPCLRHHRTPSPGPQPASESFEPPWHCLPVSVELELNPGPGLLGRPTEALGI